MIPETTYRTADAADANSVVAAEVFDSTRPNTELRFPDGRVLLMPTALLLQQLAAADAAVASDEHLPLTENESVSIPVIEEQLQVGKRTVVTGTVRLEKHVGVYEEALDVPLAVRSFDVERRVLNEQVDAPPPVRQEGETTIYPLVEEQLILTKQLVLREELRVTRRDTERQDTRTVSLRRESIEVTRS